MGGSSGDVRTAAGLIGLATGAGTANWQSLSWRDVAALAARERCVALAWLRSKDIVTRHADAEVASWWRHRALRTLARGHAQMETLREVTTALGAAGLRCVALKGAPLAAMLYGEPGARASADLDLWIPLEDRARARELLLDHGWHPADGEAPEDEAFTMPGAHGEHYLEIHSSLVHSRFGYLRFPEPAVSAVEMAGSVLPVMTGPLLPVYLAVHIAKHRFPPTQWFLDHRALWDRLDGDARELVWWTAQRCGAHRYLDWVVRRTGGLDRALNGDADALAQLGLHRERRDPHPMWRHIRLAPLPDGPFRAMRAWLLPPWVTVGGFRASDAARRLRRHWRTAIGTGRDASRQARASGVAAREVTVAGGQLLRVAREISLLGGRMWITATGTSMHPTLLERDRVLIEPATRFGIGDIVLVDCGGSPILHRVIHMDASRITTRGDARLTPDESLSRGDVIARAVRARRGNAEWSLAPSTWRRLRSRVSASKGGEDVACGSRAHA